MRLFTNIEDSFNAIWDVKTSRPLIRKFTDYITMTLLAPIFVIVSSSSTVYLEIFIKDLSDSYAIFGFLGELYVFLLKLIPFVSTWILFSLLYIVMPNTKVKPQFALLAGILTGTMYQALQYFYISFQVNVSKFNAIYGSFAALPLFLIWLQLSWLVILLGAEITYYSQHVDDFDIKEKTRTLSSRQRRLLALAFMRLLSITHRHAKPPLSILEASRQLGVPLNLVKDTAYQLLQAGLATEVNTTQSENEVGYLPALDSSLITVQYVLSQLDRLHEDAWKFSNADSFKGVELALAKSELLFEESAYNKLMHEL
jgi:membrane protein